MNFIKNSLQLFLYFVVMTAALAVGSANAYDISGTIRDSVTSNPIDGTVSPIEVVVYQGAPCQAYNWISSTTMDNINGIYTLADVPEGQYVITASNSNQSDYYAKVWWSSAGTALDCQGAQSLDITTANASGIDFSIGTGYSISGTVYESDGTTPLSTPLSVTLFQGGACDWRQNIISAPIDTTVGPTQGQYTIRGVPDGTYHLITSNDNISDYINEWYASAGSSIDCSVSEPVGVAAAPVTGIDFQLDIGGSVSGTIRDEVSVPITSFQGWADARIMLNGELHYYNSIGASGGTYTLRGLPLSPAEVYISAASNDGSFGKEYWAAAGSTPYLALAEPVAVPSSNIDLHLGPGASMQGTVVDNVGTPVANARVTYRNEANMDYIEVFTDGGGFFNIFGLSPGPAEISVVPEPASGLAWFERDDYYIDPGMARNIGKIELEPGARVYGFIKGPGDVTLPEPVEFYVSSHHHEGWEKTGTDGYFEVFLPPRGTPYYIGADDFGSYSMVPAVVAVSPGDIATGIDLGTLTAYDSGDVYSGAISGPAIGEGTLHVVALSNSSNPTTLDMGDFQMLAGADNAGGTYSLFVPPGHLSKLYLIYEHHGPDSQESITLLAGVTDQTGGGVVDFNYSLGAMVSGYITNQGEPVFMGRAVLTTTTGSFVADAETGRDGYYEIRHVPDGTYRVEVLDRKGNAIKGKLFTISGADLIVPTFDLAQGDELVVDFGPLGLYHYSWTVGWDKLSTADVQMMENLNSELMADFGFSGFYHFDGNIWNRLSTADVENITPFDGIGSLDGLYVDFGPMGLYNFDGGWTKISAANPDQIVADREDLYVDFGPAGLYHFAYHDQAWTKLSSADVEQMIDIRSPTCQKLYVDFGPAGLYQWDPCGPGWLSISTADAYALYRFDDKLVVNFGPTGLYLYDGSWTRISTSYAEEIYSIGNDLYVDFGLSGLYQYDGVTWTRLSTADAQGMGGCGRKLVVDFGVAGLYEYDGVSWTRLSTGDAEYGLPVNFFNDVPIS
jgi:hypothetical protein